MRGIKKQRRQLSSHGRKKNQIATLMHKGHLFLPVADPGFSQRGRQPSGEAPGYKFMKFSPKNCMKSRNIWSLGGSVCLGAPPPAWIRLLIWVCQNPGCTPIREVLCNFDRPGSCQDHHTLPKIDCSCQPSKSSNFNTGTTTLYQSDILRFKPRGILWHTKKIIISCLVF